MKDMNSINIKLLEFLKKFLANKPTIRNFVKEACGPQIIVNINKRCRKQINVLLCYLPQCFEPNIKPISHPNLLHANAMVNAFIDFDCSIDVCYCNDERAAVILENNSYDYIFGFGKVFNTLMTRKCLAEKILIVTENDPSVVLEKYQERIEYFHRRHPNTPINKFVPRTNFYSPDSFHNASSAIVMTSSFNINNFKRPFVHTYPINVNGIYNINYNIEDKLSNQIPSNRFVWLGSLGLLHKGLDILVDAFAECPELQLDVYGANTDELKALDFLPNNVHIKGFVDVLSDNFIQVALNNAYIISTSCSEGMSTAIATGMLHGLIPIITKETGYDEHKSIIFLEDYSIESVKQTIVKLSKYDQDILHVLSKDGYEYAHTSFTLEHFESSIKKIIGNIIK